MKTVRTLTLLLCATLITACGGTAPAPTTNAAAATPIATPALAPAKLAQAAPKLDAAGVIRALAKRGLKIRLGRIYNERTDPNHMMGRPHGYTSKAVLWIGKHEGSVEVFAKASQAQKRRDYIQEIGERASVLGEYTYVRRGVVLRLAKELLPSQARKYQATLNKVVP
ncbi:hypothetical protein [Sinosporangium siamense]|uniref:Uncharacterized protein n=1 Tax=Sinosporangium siamense TaxID=1367973 RepID=A0A919RQN7_9ACTN|nr:hypothetical protein [Sinosporangium siamense]GII96929.1 hypothetical protein Ssi02_71600 [Sinosporangium siamense]